QPVPPRALPGQRQDAVPDAPVEQGRVQPLHAAPVRPVDPAGEPLEPLDRFARRVRCRGPGRLDHRHEGVQPRLRGTGRLPAPPPTPPPPPRPRVAPSFPRALAPALTSSCRPPRSIWPTTATLVRRRATFSRRAPPRLSPP